MEEQPAHEAMSPALHPEHGRHRVVSGVVAVLAVGVLLAALWYLYGDLAALRLGGATETDSDALLPAPPPVPDLLPVLNEEPLPDTSAPPTQTP